MKRTYAGFSYHFCNQKLWNNSNLFPLIEIYLNASNKKAAACFIANSLNIFKLGPRSGIQKIKIKTFFIIINFLFSSQTRGVGPKHVSESSQLCRWVISIALGIDLVFCNGWVTVSYCYCILLWLLTVSYCYFQWVIVNFSGNFFSFCSLLKPQAYRL